MAAEARHWDRGRSWPSERDHALIELGEKSSAEDKAAMMAALRVPAEVVFAAASAAGFESEVMLAAAYSPGNISQQVRSLCKLDEGDLAVAMAMLDIADDGAVYLVPRGTAMMQCKPLPRRASTRCGLSEQRS